MLDQAKQIVKMGAPIMKKLSAIQASTATPFFPILRKVTPALMVTRMQQEMFGVSDNFVHLQLMRIAVVAMNSDLYPANMSPRWMTMYSFGLMYAMYGQGLKNRQVQKTVEEMQKYTIRPPKMPLDGKDMIFVGCFYLFKAWTESKAAMGIEIEGGGVIGREILGAVNSSMSVYKKLYGMPPTPGQWAAFMT